ncbi:DUF3179 domain-containing (seleno)protein [Vibrio parahaemolyticus]|uniref:DUF3179 domain-containing (seleno)protein n=1 Tax=Vibrio mediterranei TaxID=689 RepID=UPI0040687061
MTISSLFIITALAVSLYYSFLLFRDLADISQWVIQTERKKTLTSWYQRKKLIAFGSGALLVSWLVWGLTDNLLSFTMISIISIINAAMLFSGAINPELMMRGRQGNGLFVDVQEGKKYVDSNESVIVTVVNGDARAHSDKQMLRPHVASNGLQGGENVVMTYCGLTNLGVAFNPEIDGVPVKLRPMTQLKNNLVLADEVSGEPIQQLWGQKEVDVLQNNASKMSEVPTFRMPYHRFVEVFPEGSVYVNDYLAEDLRTSFWMNPFKFCYDRCIELIFRASVRYQHTSPKPVFPTIKNIDGRLPSKDLVWGFNIDDDYVAYTEAFVRQNGNLVNAVIGGKDVVISYDQEAESLGVFYNPARDSVNTVDVHGTTDLGTVLKRVETVKSGAFWIVWANFFPETGLNIQS